MKMEKVQERRDYVKNYKSRNKGKFSKQKAEYHKKHKKEKMHGKLRRNPFNLQHPFALRVK